MEDARSLLHAVRGTISQALSQLEYDGGGRPPTPGSVIFKSAEDPQTDIDVLLETRIGEGLLRLLPEASLVGEEIHVEPPDTDLVWYLDPLDGTKNLLAARAEIAVSVALYSDGQPIIGIIVLPCRGLEVSTSQGISGILLNDEPLSATRREGAARFVGLPGDPGLWGDADRLSILARAASAIGDGVRITGAIAYDLACLSIGELVARVSLRAKPVDAAAGAFLVEQAGGVVTDLTGRRWTPHSNSVVAAANAEQHAQLSALLRKMVATTDTDR